MKGDSQQSALVRPGAEKTLIEFLDHLDSLGVKLWSEDNRLRYRAPKGVVTLALRAQLAERKQEILGLLGQTHLDSSTPEQIRPVARDKDLPLSFAQQRLWFLDRLEGPSATYNIPTALRLTGPLDVEALAQALDEIVRRHKVMRTTFMTVDGEPAQVIAPALTIPLPVVDLRHLPEEEQTAEVKRLANEQAQRPFDLATGPLVRATLLRLATKDTSSASGQADHIALFTMHHIISDGWSNGVLVRELSTLYGAFTADQPSPLPALPIQYADYAVWQRERLSGGALEKQIDYWKQQLDGIPAFLELPTDHPRPPVQTFKGNTVHFEINHDLPRQLRACSRQADATLFMTLFAAFAALLSRYSGQEDIVIGSPIANRNHAEIEALIGFFVNTLMLRVNLSGDPTFRELLEQVRLATLDAYTHQDVPLEKLIQELRIPRDPSYNPLAQVAFAFQDFTTLPVMTLPGLAITSLEIDMGVSKTDLTVFMQDDAKGLQCTVEYKTDLFEPATIERVAEDFRRLLNVIASDPAQRLSDIWQASGIMAMPLTVPRAEKEAQADVYASSNLTRNQLLVWLGQKLQPDVPLYNMTHILTISGQFHPEHFQKAFQALVNSSDALRTVIEQVNGVPQQRVIASFSYTLDYVDFSQRPETEVRAWLRERVQKPLDLEKRLFDSVLIKIADEKYTWFVNWHNIVVDGWSFYQVIVPRISEFYGRSLQGSLEEGGELYPFWDYVAYEQEYINSARYAKAQAYWKQKLESLEPIRFYGKHPTRQTTRVQRVFCDLGRERSERLKAIAAHKDVFVKTLNVSLFNIFAALLGTCLHHISGLRRLSLGTPFHNRRAGDFRQTVGLLMKVLPLRITIEKDDTFLSLVQKLAVEATETLQHSQYAIGNPSQNRSYDVFFNQITRSLPSFPGATMAEEWLHSGHANESLGLQILINDAASESIVLAFDFHCDVFYAEQQRQAVRHFLHVIDGFLDDHTQSITDFSLLSDEERQRVLVEFNQTQGPLPEHQTMAQFFQAQARKTPDRVAVEFKDQALTYAQLNARANQLAHHLRSLGVGPEALVGVYMERSPEMIIGMLGILKAGGAYVPLDPTYPAERLGFMLADTQATVLLTQERLMASLPEHKARVICLDTGWTAIAQESTANPISAARPANLAYVMYTSGSTGKPKGVMIEHRSLVCYTENSIAQFALRPGDRVLQFSSPSFDISVEEIFSCLTCGATLVIRTDEMLASIAVFLAKCQEWGITVFSLPTAFWHEIAAGLDKGLAFPSSLRLVIIGGEKARAKWTAVWQERVGQRAQFMNTYGPTEATVTATRYELPGQADKEWRETPIGRAIRNTQIYILDQSLHPVPIGVPGELYIGGAGLARGYLNRPELTAEKFIPNPFGEAAGSNGSVSRLYNTGDLARYLPDGNIEFLERVDFQVKLRGFRIELGEIETVLAEHPAVRANVVIVREDQPDDKRLVAYIVGEITHSELRDHLEQKLPDYMIPSASVRLKELPLSPVGKVDRRALPAPDEGRPELAATFVAPQTEAERVIATVWREVLEVDKVDIHDNFFDLGGHSLTMVKIHIKLQEMFARDFSLVEMFRRPTIGILAEYLTQEPDDQLSIQKSHDRANKQREAIKRQRQRMRAVSRGRAAGRRRDESQ